MALQAKTKLVNGQRIDLSTNKPFTGGLGTPTMPQAITPQNLATPTAPVSVPTTPPSTVGTGFQGYLEALTANAKKAAEQSQSDYQKTINEYLGKGNEQLQLERQADIGGKTAAVTDYTNQLEAEQQALRRRTEKLEKNATGMSAGAIADEVNRVQRESLSTQADIAILGNAAQRKLTDAQNLIARKIELKYEPLKEKINFLRDFNSQNQSNLTKAETAQLNFLQSQEERTYNEARLKDERAYDMFLKAAENGAPATVQTKIQSAINSGDYATAQQLAAPYMADSNSLATLPGPIQTRVQAIASQFDAEQAVKNYQTSAEAIDALNSAGISPTDDIARVYAFAKVMDPNSVVREGEYNTVQEYATAVLERAGLKAKRIFENTGFLTPEARLFMKSTLDNRLASSKKAYDNIYSEYGRRINKVTGRTDGTDYITDYSRAFVPTEISSDDLIYEQEFRDLQSGLNPSQLGQIEQINGFFSNFFSQIFNNNR